ncbi:MAG: hypothetical protein LBG52_06500 [Candidatus Peribacteria bacterium]|jgi:hypothetical protein|nr:hypothetical protein [Candidatus Peribacteria bacterium]
MEITPEQLETLIGEIKDIFYAEAFTQKVVPHLTLESLIILQTLIAQKLILPPTPEKQKHLFESLGKIYQYMVDSISPSVPATETLQHLEQAVATIKDIA